MAGDDYEAVAGLGLDGGGCRPFFGNIIGVHVPGEHALYSAVFYARARFYCINCDGGDADAEEWMRDRVVLHGGFGLFFTVTDTWELDPGPSASYTTYGLGCSGSTILPTVSAQNGTLPSVNTQFSVQVNGLPFTAPSFMWLGFSNQTYSGYPLPLDLGFLGAPGCEVLITPDFLYPIPNILGTGVWTLGIPNVPGTVFYNQVVSLDASFPNSLGLVFSNASESVVGQ